MDFIFTLIEKGVPRDEIIKELISSGMEKDFAEDIYMESVHEALIEPILGRIEKGKKEGLQKQEIIMDISDHFQMEPKDATSMYEKITTMEQKK